MSAGTSATHATKGSKTQVVSREAGGGGGGGRGQGRPVATHGIGLSLCIMSPIKAKSRFE